MQPPWSSNWTSNINIEMNYWARGDLQPERLQPDRCSHLIGGSEPDRRARGPGDVRPATGWVTHHNIDIWRAANPVGMGVGASDVGQLGDERAVALRSSVSSITGSRTITASSCGRGAYPAMKGSAEFCLEWLIDGWSTGI